MGLPVLILGKSGSGKSTSLRHFEDGEIALINVLGKPLPFKSKIKTYVTDEYPKIFKAIAKAKTNSIVIDDAGYLITNMFMRGHSSTGAGNGVFSFFNQVGDSFWNLIQYVVQSLPPERIVYFIMHEEKNDFGDIKPKTIGKLLDEKVCLEGMFTIVFRAAKENDRHVFFTKSKGFDVSKTPMGMFESEEIDNDLKMIDETIRAYYELGGITNETVQKLQNSETDF